MTYKIKKLPLNETTVEGSYWAEENEQKVGETVVLFGTHDPRL